MEQITIDKEILHEVDELLAHLEDYIHGTDGTSITELRKKILYFLYA